jgi:hypothetical protein
MFYRIGNNNLSIVFAAQVLLTSKIHMMEANRRRFSFALWFFVLSSIEIQIAPRLQPRICAHHQNVNNKLKYYPLQVQKPFFIFLSSLLCQPSPLCTS